MLEFTGISRTRMREITRKPPSGWCSGAIGGSPTTPKACGTGLSSVGTQAESAAGRGWTRWQMVSLVVGASVGALVVRASFRGAEVVKPLKGYKQANTSSGCSVIQAENSYNGLFYPEQSALEGSSPPQLRLHSVVCRVGHFVDKIEMTFNDGKIVGIGDNGGWATTPIALKGRRVRRVIAYDYDSFSHGVQRPVLSKITFRLDDGQDISCGAVDHLVHSRITTWSVAEGEELVGLTRDSRWCGRVTGIHTVKNEATSLMHTGPSHSATEHRRVQSVHFRYGAYLDKLTFTYDSGSSCSWGGEGGHVSVSLELQPGEYITGLELGHGLGSLNGHPMSVLFQVVVTTTKRTRHFGPTNLPGLSYNTWKAGKGEMIVGVLREDAWCGVITAIQTVKISLSRFNGPFPVTRLVDETAPCRLGPVLSIKHLWL